MCVCVCVYCYKLDRGRMLELDRGLESRGSSSAAASAPDARALRGAHLAPIIVNSIGLSVCEKERERERE